MNPSKPKNYRVLEGRWGLAGSIAETSLAGGASATAVFWLWMAGSTGIAILEIFRALMGILFIAITLFLGVRVLEQVNYYLGNPGVDEKNPTFIKNEGIVPFKRAWIVLLSVTIFYSISFIFVLISIKGFK